MGTVKHLDGSEREQLTIKLLSDEALKTSEIEGEHLDRENVQSSVRKQFGLQVESKGRIPSAAPANRNTPATGCPPLPNR